MKLKWVNRFLLTFGALIVFAIGAASLLVLCGILPFHIPDPAAGGSYYSWQRMTVFGACLYLMLYAVFVFFYPGKYYYNNKDFIIQKTEGGDLLISVKAIESLVQQCVDKHEEVRASNMKVIPIKKGGVVIKMKLIVPNNISIPLSVANLQKQIKQYVLASSGVQVNNVVVTVEKTSGAVAVSSLEDAENGKQSEEKKPIHQRIFEREDSIPEETPAAAEGSAENNPDQEAGTPMTEDSDHE